MKKRATIIILVFIILFSLLPIASASDVSQTKRHVAMVYDDSTSMYISDTTNKPVLNWAYANYMTQAFYGLLNPIDSLYITYMSDVEKETSPTNLMLMDRASALDSIRNKNDYINKTPFEAVETAYNLLYDLEEDLTDEYWLVILTDGAFTGFKKDTTEVLNEYIDQMALASKTLKVVFFAIGNDTKPPIADETKGLFVYSTSSNGIISTMSQVADNISGRHAVSDSNMKLISDNTLEVDMLLPVRSLTILYQQEENTLNSISNETSDSMELLNSYSIKAPEVFEISDEYTIITDENANGMITSIKPDKDEMILSSGKYILEFENEINIENVRVMYEPAIDITLVYKKGTTVVDVLKKGDIISVEVLLVNAKDGTPLDKNALPVPVTCNIQLSSDGELVKSADDFILKDIIITSGNTSIASQITMPGYFTLRDRVDFDVAHPIESTPSPTPGITSTPGVYDDTQGPWPPEVKLVLMPPFAQNIPLDKLEETDPFLFVPSFNGERGQLKDLQLGQLQVICSSEIVFEIIINDTEMGFDIYPKYANGMLTTATGTINASIIFKSEYNKVATTSLSFIVKELSWLRRNLRNLIIIAIALFFTLSILGILVLRYKFSKESYLVYTQERKNSDETWSPIRPQSRASLTNLHGKWRFIPFKAENISISGIVFKATANDQVIKIPKKYVTKNITTFRGPLSRKNDYKTDFALISGIRIYLGQELTRISFVYHGPKRSLFVKKNLKKGNKRRI